ncbi:MAG: 30S ribosomal protein S8 [Planctomycetota bacterium]
MALSDPIADMLNRLRNASRNGFPTVDCMNSKVCAGIAAALEHEGYVNGHTVIDDGRQGILRVELRYGPNGEKLFHKMQRESKPGCRVYTKVADLPRPLAGLGVCILTTPKGVLSDRQCREHNVGGEMICTVE